MKKFILLSFLCIFSLSCSYTSESDLIEASTIPSTVFYNADVKIIIDNNCIVCHNNPPVNNASIPLITFENVKNAIENNNLIGRISTQDLGVLMPFGGPRLPQNLIDIIIKWEADGLLE